MTTNPSQIERAVGTVKRGIYYKGFAAAGREGKDGTEFILITADMVGLRMLWDELMPITPLNENEVEEVSLFRQTTVTHSVKETGDHDEL